jgi:hypothetical protein
MAADSETIAKMPMLRPAAPVVRARLSAAALPFAICVNRSSSRDSFEREGLLNGDDRVHIQND